MHYAKWVEAGRVTGEVDAVLKYFPREPGTAAGFTVTRAVDSAKTSQRDLPGQGLLDFLRDSSCNKQMLLVRNPIQRAYSSWAFWCFANTDRGCGPQGGWVVKTPNALPRVAKNFDWWLNRPCGDSTNECNWPPFTKDFSLSGWVTSAVKAAYGAIPVDSWQVRSIPSTLNTDGTGDRRLSIIRTEFMKEEPAETMKAVYDHLGLRAPASAEKWGAAINTGANPGIHAQGDHNHQEPMLEASKKLLCRMLEYNRHLTTAPLWMPILESDRDLCA